MAVTRTRRLLRWLTAATIVVAFLSTLSYGAGAHMAVRFVAPAAGAWWNANEFWFMEGAATALGLLIAIRLCAHLVDDQSARTRTSLTALVVAAILLYPIARVCARIARLGWTARESGFHNRLVGLAGYGAANNLDKVSIAGVYSLKTAAFGFLIGLALFGFILVVYLRPDSVPAGESPAPR